MANKSDKIVGTARLGGETFSEGEEDLLAAKAEEMGVNVDRAYGVDSTEKRSERKLRGPEQRARALARKQGGKQQGEGKGAVSEVDSEEFLGTPVSDLAEKLEGVENVGALQKLKRKDSRVSAKPLYDARIEALKAAESGADDETETEE